MNRTVVASILTASALAIPLGAWYVAGARDAAREAERIEAEPARAAQALADALAVKLAARLEDLREVESRRPFYQYQNLYYDPEAAADGPAIVPSPLADGPLDPLVHAYFQIDAQGNVSLPTLNNEIPERNRHENLPLQRQIWEEIAANTADLLAAAREAARQAEPPPASAASGSPPRAPQALLEEAQPQTSSPIPLSQTLNLQQADRGQARYLELVQTLEPADAELLKANPNKAYQTLKQRRAGTTGQEPFQADPGKKAASAGQGKVSIRTEPLRWRTVPVGGGVALAALREVSALGDRLAQGLMVSTPAVEAYLRSPATPVRFRPGRPERPGEARVPVPGADWVVSVDPAHAGATARAAAGEVVRRFRRTFGLGAAAAIIAGFLVVGLVWQSDRLARQRSRFAASAAHELRTPLAGLRMYGEMLAEGLGDPAKSKDYARRVADEAERLGRVVSNVLGFSRLERGALAVRPGPGDLGAAVRECVERQRPALEALGANVALRVAAGLPPVRFDRDAVAQILQNLLDNAEKYARGAGDRTIDVTVRGVPGPTELVRVELAVADRGPGVPTDVCARLFQPFARGGGADAPAGLGLGLALARALARAMGGDLRHDAAPGAGAVFTLVLPLA